MFDFFKKLLDVSDFPPRWNCGNWDQFTGWLHIGSDVTIAMCYFAIPLILMHFISKKKSFPQHLKTPFLLFSTFVFFCGLGHALDAVIFYYPIYRILGLVKLCTAIISAVTALFMFFLLPILLNIETPKERNQSIKRFCFFSLAFSLFLLPLDCVIPLGTNMGIIYIAIIFSVLLTDESIVQTCILCCTNILLGWYISLGITDFTVVTNRLLALFTLITSALLVSIIRNKSQHENQLIEDLQDSNEELESFAYVTSHDLKAPLRAIINLASWIAEDLDDVNKPEVKENLNLMIKRVDKMNNLIDGILRYSRIGKTNLETSILNLNEIVQDQINLINVENLQIQIENLPEIYGNEVQIREIFSNLISNAIKYNDKENGYIKIYCEDKDKEYQFTIEDNGIGIDSKYHDRIFEMFQTLNTDSTIDSTGIGLTLVKKIIENKNGNIWIESELNKGSKFIFTLPKVIVI